MRGFFYCVIYPFNMAYTITHDAPYTAMNRWLVDNVIVITHMLSGDPNDDIRVGHTSRDMRPLACTIDSDAFITR